MQKQPFNLLVDIYLEHILEKVRVN